MNRRRRLVACLCRILSLLPSLPIVPRRACPAVAPLSVRRRLCQRARRERRGSHFKGRKQVGKRTEKKERKKKKPSPIFSSLSSLEFCGRASEENENFFHFFSNPLFLSFYLFQMQRNSCSRRPPTGATSKAAMSTVAPAASSASSFPSRSSRRSVVARAEAGAKEKVKKKKEKETIEHLHD